MNLDERFLTVHPRTALWWKQREQCAKCANLSRRQSQGRDPILTMQCKAVLWGGQDSSCINARDDGQPCGPSGKLFMEAVTA